jgi:hypothetical protein
MSFIVRAHEPAGNLSSPARKRWESGQTGESRWDGIGSEPQALIR